jgi:CBS domain-containing protein
VADIMTPEPRVGPWWVPVDVFVDQYVLGHPHSAYPVEDADGRVTGLVTLACLRNVPPRLRSQTPVGAVAIPLAEVPRATPEEPAAALLERLPPGGRALVFEGDRLVGIVTWTDIARTMEIRDIVGTTEPPKRPGSTGPRH